MLFSSTEFLLMFLPATIAGFALAVRLISMRAGTAWLLACSLFFYAYWSPPLLPLLLASIVVNFACGRALFRNRSRSFLVAGLIFNLGLLAYFKYAGFLVENIEQIIGSEIVNLNIVLPLAISFFTFQQVAYLVDVYQGKADEPDFLNYCLFVSFFPQLISGPIVHHSEMMPQFRQSARKWLSRSLVPVALGFIAIGLYKKVVLADGLGPIADQVFAHAANGGIPSTGDAWVGAIAYAFQIYFDFSGYSDMAVGVALLFGIRLPLNFNSPYKATSIIDFWRRWHITLSRFIRDYIYIPLGGNRKGKHRRYVNLVLAMLIGGLWHGAGWTFVVWGGCHGVFLMLNHGWRRLRPRSGAPGFMTVWTSRAVTFCLVVIAWVFFRAADIDDAGRMLQGMFGLEPGRTVLESGRHILWLVLVAFIVWCTPNTWQLFRKADPVVVPAVAGEADEDGVVVQTVMRFRRSVMVPLIVMIGIVGLFVVIDRGNQAQRFIYMIF